MSVLNNILSYLNENKEAKVEDILDHVSQMMQTAKRGDNYISYKGETVAVLCSHHNVWETLVGDGCSTYRSRKTNAKLTSGVYQHCVLGGQQRYAKDKAYKESKDSYIAQWMSHDIKPAKCLELVKGLDDEYVKPLELPENFKSFLSDKKEDVQAYIEKIWPSVLEQREEDIDSLAKKVVDESADETFLGDLEKENVEL